MTDARFSQPANAAEGLVDQTGVEAAPVDGVRGEADVVTSETLVEEVSIDGMCGVY